MIPSKRVTYLLTVSSVRDNVLHAQVPVLGCILQDLVKN